jgi:hypothetical protein
MCSAKNRRTYFLPSFDPADVSDGKLSGQSFRKGETGAPILIGASSAIGGRWETVR